VIAVRAETDRAALRPLPAQPYLVAEKHLRPGREGLPWSPSRPAAIRFGPGKSGPGNGCRCRSIQIRPETGSPPCLGRRRRRLARYPPAGNTPRRLGC
jgi:hypothetical protein